MHGYEENCKRIRSNGGEHSDIASYVSRWNENAWKIALLLHAAKHLDKAHEHELSVDTAAAALVLMGWFTKCQLELLAGPRRSKHRGRVLKVLQVLTPSKPKITLRDLKNSHGFADAEVRLLAGKYPQYFHLIKTATGGKGGRPSECLVLGPAPAGSQAPTTCKTHENVKTGHSAAPHPPPFPKDRYDYPEAPPTTGTMRIYVRLSEKRVALAQWPCRGNAHIRRK